MAMGAEKELWTLLEAVVSKYQGVASKCTEKCGWAETIGHDV